MPGTEQALTTFGILIILVTRGGKNLEFETVGQELYVAQVM